MEVTYQQIRDSKPDTIYVDDFGDFWYRDAIIEQMDVAGLDPFLTLPMEWIQFWAYDGPIGDSDTVYGR